MIGVMDTQKGVLTIVHSGTNYKKFDFVNHTTTLVSPPLKYEISDD
jgi:hypothetical protein